MPTKKKTKKKPVNFEKAYNKLMADMESVCFTLFEVKEMVTSGTITHKDLIEELYELCHSMSDSLGDSDRFTDPYYEDAD